MKLDISSGEVRIQVEANTIEKAFVKALHVLQLEGFGMFIFGHEHGRSADNERVGLTEWYLPEAGYEKFTYTSKNGSTCERWREKK